MSDSTVAIGHSDLLANDVMKFLENFNAQVPDLPALMQSNLISDDQPDHATAPIQDPNLINPWGIAYSPTGPFWVSNNQTGTSTVYSVDPTTNAPTQEALVVTIATPGQTTPATPPGTTPTTPPGTTPATPPETTAASPTGVVFNDTQGFLVNDVPSSFIFATEDGTLSAWNSTAGTESVLQVDNSTNPDQGDPTVPPAGSSGAVYKGLAIGDNAGQNTLYAANFRHGTVDMFNDQFQQVGSFTDSSLPAGYAPFNAQVLDNHVFVTFALQDELKEDDISGAGQGFVDEFDMNGQLIGNVASNGPLNSPWGLAIAPQDFGQFAGDLLVGNFGDGTINAYDLQTDMLAGTLQGVDGNPIVIDDLWALTPGNGGAAGNPGNIYFTAGGKDEAQGVFGSLAPVPGTNNMFSVST